MKIGFSNLKHGERGNVNKESKTMEETCHGDNLVSRMTYYFGGTDMEHMMLWFFLHGNFWAMKSKRNIYILLSSEKKLCQ